jgi:hypothetical protein
MLLGKMQSSSELRFLLSILEVWFLGGSIVKTDTVPFSSGTGLSSDLNGSDHVVPFHVHRTVVVVIMY